jgi:hypothetical protein
MMSRRAFVGVAGAMAILLSGCGSSETFRYKMAVELETPQGVKTGFAVREVSYYARPAGGGGMRVRGEAVMVDIGPGKTLFALLTGANGDGDYAAGVFDFALKAEMEPGGANTGYIAGKYAELYPTAPRTKSPIQFGALPMLVTFSDINDPKSVEQVDPADLAASFGVGVRLKRIVIEKTDEDVTTGTQKRLPEPLYKGFFNWDGNIKEFDQSKVFAIWDFIRGVAK